ncbi:MAG TPA: serine hydrolase [Candidatus Eisenbacteria bacterium]|nr:serine hydrolase [Candidatus Eisenbacteria bacterium]
MSLRLLAVTVTMALTLPLAPAAHAGSSSLATPVYDYMATRRGTIAVAVYDLVSRQQWWWHISVRSSTASIVKVDILAALLRRNGTLSASQRTLAAAMIERSDNTGATTLYRQIGGATGLRAFNSVAGLTMTTPSSSWGLTRTSSLDQVRLLRRLAEPNSVLTSSQRSYELALMAQVVSSQRWGVSGGVPAGVTVSLKNGWLPLSAARGGGWQVNSIGYVHGLGRRYVIAVLTHSPSFSYGVATISRISAIVWAHMARATAAAPTVASAAPAAAA